MQIKSKIIFDHIKNMTEYSCDDIWREKTHMTLVFQCAKITKGLYSRLKERIGGCIPIVVAKQESDGWFREKYVVTDKWEEYVSKDDAIRFPMDEKFFVKGISEKIYRNEG